jgi:hypothetical protein
MEFINSLSKDIIGFPSKITLFIYKVVKDGEHPPFIEFILENKKNIYYFPSFEYNTHMKKKHHQVVMNRAILLLQNTLQNNDRIDEKLKNEIYKGCIQDETGDEITLFFDCTYLFSDLENIYTYTLMDEVLHHQHIANIHIHSSVPQFFLKTAPLVEGFSIPLLLYGCKQTKDTDRTVESSTKTVTDLEQTPLQGAVSNLHRYKTINEFENIYRINHPNHGNYFYFTKTILDDCVLAQRFAVFTTSYHLTKTFEENGNKYWCIKTENQIVKI